MSTSPILHFVFVDFENVHDIDLGLIADQSVHVTLLIGRAQKKIDLSLVRQIHRLAAQVALIEVGAAGHNALDLTLALYLGQAAQHHPDAKFFIVSKDRDFDPLIAHLRHHTAGVAVSRVGQFQLLPFLASSAKSEKAKAVTAQRRADVLARLRDHTATSRPRTLRKLRAYLLSSLGNGTSEAQADEVITELVADTTLAIGPTGRILYRVVDEPPHLTSAPLSPEASTSLASRCPASTFQP
jgi:hypothetical protein